MFCDWVEPEPSGRAKLSATSSTVPVAALGKNRICLQLLPHYFEVLRTWWCWGKGDDDLEGTKPFPQTCCSSVVLECSSGRGPLDLWYERGVSWVLSCVPRVFAVTGSDDSGKQIDVGVGNSRVMLMERFCHVLGKLNFSLVDALCREHSGNALGQTWHNTPVPCPHVPISAWRAPLFRGCSHSFLLTVPRWIPLRNGRNPCWEAECLSPGGMPR